jgi:hypothetical protein
LTRKGWPALVPARAHHFHSFALGIVLLFVALASHMNAAEPAINAGSAPVKSAARAARVTAMAMLPQAAQPGPKIWLGERKPLGANYVGAPQAVSAQAGVARPGQNSAVTQPAPEQLLASGQASPLGLISADFDEDGVNDLAVGYSLPGGSGIIAIHRGNLDAFAPQSDASFQAIAHGQFPDPFLPDAQVFTVPVTPDFVVAGNFVGKGHQDLLIAARGGTALYVLPGDGKGHFGTPQVVSLSGSVTALIAGNLGGAATFSNVMLGVSSPKGASLLIYGGTAQGLIPLGSYKLSAPATTIILGDLDGDSRPDLAVLAGGQVSILHGATRKLETVSLPLTATGLALGSFIFDRDSREQMAILAADGSVSFAVHSSFDPRPFTSVELQAMHLATVNGEPNPVVPAPAPGEGWVLAERVAAAAPYGKQMPLFFSTRISGNAADDVMVLNPSGSQLAMISHPNLRADSTTFIAGQLSLRAYSGTPVGAHPMRLNVDGRPGIMVLHQGEISPSSLMPLPDPTFTVDTTSDIINTGATPCASATAGQCSLRQAIFETNAIAGVDTIMVPAGTYTLTIADVAEKHDATTGELSITDGLNIIGAVDGSGNPTTLIQACTVNPGSAVGSTCVGAGGTGITEKPFSVNPNFNKAFDTSFSNLEIRFGHNNGSFVSDGFGGGFDWEASHTGTMTVTNCNIHDNAIEDGSGSGITATNTGGGTGNFTMSNSTVSHNVAQRQGANSGRGGGIFFGSATRFTITNSHIDNNQAVNGAGPEGAGIFIFNPGTTPISVIHGGTISGNGSSSVVRGGGIRTTAGITIDQGTVISGNTAQEGAGLWTNLGTSTGFPSG